MGFDSADEVFVHVTGRVARPGLYRLEAGSRVADAIDRAGGPLPDAAVDALNLARTLADGDQLRVPGLHEVPAGGPGAAAAGGPGTGTAGGLGAGAAGGPGGAWSADGTLDLNRATAADLEQLPGIGPVLAQRIVDYRDEARGFRDVGQLREVRGIGEKTFASIADLVRVP